MSKTFVVLKYLPYSKKHWWGKNFWPVWKITAFCQVLCHFSQFPTHSLYKWTSTCQFFSAKLPTVLIHQSFYCLSYLLYGSTKDSLLKLTLLTYSYVQCLHKQLMDWQQLNHELEVRPICLDNFGNNKKLKE